MSTRYPKPLEITDENITEVLREHPLMVVEFRTSICSPCAVMERETLKPLIERIAREYHGKVVFGRAGIDRNPRLARKFDVRSSMTFLLFREGELVDRIAGIKAKDSLKERIEKTLLN